MERVKVVFDVGNSKVPFNVLPEEEHIYVSARSQLLKRLAELKSKYSGSLINEDILMMLAIEALVDGLIVNERYTLLKDEVNKRLNLLQDNLGN